MSKRSKNIFTQLLANLQEFILTSLSSSGQWPDAGPSYNFVLVVPGSGGGAAQQVRY